MNNLPLEILSKIKLYLSHPCADMIKKLQDDKYVRSFSWDRTYDYFTFIECLLKAGNLRCKHGFVRCMRNCRYLDRQRFDSGDADIDRANAEHLSSESEESESEDDVRGFFLILLVLTWLMVAKPQVMNLILMMVRFLLLIWIPL